MILKHSRTKSLSHTHSEQKNTLYTSVASPFGYLCNVKNTIREVISALLQPHTRCDDKQLIPCVSKSRCLWWTRKHDRVVLCVPCNKNALTAHTTSLNDLKVKAKKDLIYSLMGRSDLHVGEMVLTGFCLSLYTLSLCLRGFFFR